MRISSLEGTTAELRSALSPGAPLRGSEQPPRATTASSNERREHQIPENNTCLCSGDEAAGAVTPLHQEQNVSMILTKWVDFFLKNSNVVPMWHQIKDRSGFGDDPQ